MVIFGAAMWVLHRTLPVLSVIPAPWTQLGWLVMAIAPIAPIAAFIQFSRAHTTVNPHKPDAATTLVTSGVYSFTRNPMYLGLSIVLLGWAIKLGTLSSLLGPILFVPLIQFVQIGPEEDALRRRFPNEYEAYRQSANRWFGRSRRL